MPEYREVLYFANIMSEYIEKCGNLQISCLNSMRSITLYEYHALMYQEVLHSANKPEYIVNCYTLQISCLNSSRNVTLCIFHSWEYIEKLYSLQILCLNISRSAALWKYHARILWELLHAAYISTRLFMWSFFISWELKVFLGSQCNLCISGSWVSLLGQED
jgi:hypothetical protein